MFRLFGVNVKVLLVSASEIVPLFVGPIAQGPAIPTQFFRKSSEAASLVTVEVVTHTFDPNAQELLIEVLA